LDGIQPTVWSDIEVNQVIEHEEELHPRDDRRFATWL
jgi:hypothetical protein